MRALVSGTKAYQAFVILSTPRSGSTLLHTYLNSNLHIQSLGEQPWRDLENTLVKDYFGPYPRMIRAVGFKVFYQFSIDKPYVALYNELKSRQGLKVIHLTRENKLAQYMSEELAWQKRTWTKKGTAVEDKLVIDLTAFDAYLDKHVQLQAQCLKDFTDKSLLSLSYESLIDDSEKVLRDIQEFLGVPSRKLFTVMEKQSTQPLFELVENVDEVRAKYPQYFDAFSIDIYKK